MRFRIGFLLPFLLPLLAGLGGCTLPEGLPWATASRPRSAAAASRPVPVRRDTSAAAQRSAPGREVVAAARGEDDASRESADAAQATAAAMSGGGAASAAANAVDAAARGALSSPGGGSSGWRVRADGTVGCALPGPLRVVRGELPALAEQTPADRRRAIAEALDEGRCLTTFRVNEWTLLRREGDRALLRLTNPRPGPGESPVELWFLCRDLIDPAGAREPGGTGGEGRCVADQRTR